MRAKNPAAVFFLGTDTKYTPNPTLNNNYPRGETLSFIARQVLSDGKDATIDDDGNAETGAKTLEKSTLDLYNGPETLGSDKERIIANGLMSALKFIAQGHNIIDLIGHSRGAVEAIIVAHELQRIKQEIADCPDKDIKDIICNSPDTKTRKALEDLLKEAQPNELFTNIQQNIQLDDFNVRLFAIDPVPGDEYFGSIITQGSWKDERFHQIPEIVSQVQLFTLINERSHCFATLVPKIINPDKTQMQWIPLPGNHGTASGNQLCQNKKPHKFSEGKRTSDVQNLVACKLVDFLQRSGHKFNQNDLNTNSAELNNRQNPLNLDHSPLFDTFSAYYNNPNKLHLKLEYYGHIKANRDEFRRFNQTFYATGHEMNASARFISPNLDDSSTRLVHHEGYNHTPLAQITGEILDENFINNEHATLALLCHLGLLNFNPDPIEQFEIILTKLEEPNSPSPSSTDFFIPTEVKHAFYELAFNLVEKCLEEELTIDEKDKISAILTKCIEYSKDTTPEEHDFENVKSPIAVYCQELHGKLVEAFYLKVNTILQDTEINLTHMFISCNLTIENLEQQKNELEKLEENLHALARIENLTTTEQLETCINKLNELKTCIGGHIKTLNEQAETTRAFEQQILQTEQAERKSRERQDEVNRLTRLTGNIFSDAQNNVSTFKITERVKSANTQAAYNTLSQAAEKKLTDTQAAHIASMQAKEQELINTKEDCNKSIQTKNNQLKLELTQLKKHHNRKSGLIAFAGLSLCALVSGILAITIGHIAICVGTVLLIALSSTTLLSTPAGWKYSLYKYKKSLTAKVSNTNARITP